MATENTSVHHLIITNNDAPTKLLYTTEMKYSQQTGTTKKLMKDIGRWQQTSVQHILICMLQTVQCDYQHRKMT